MKFFLNVSIIKVLNNRNEKKTLTFQTLGHFFPSFPKFFFFGSFLFSFLFPHFWGSVLLFVCLFVFTPPININLALNII